MWSSIVQPCWYWNVIHKHDAVICKTCLSLAKLVNCFEVKCQLRICSLSSLEMPILGAYLTRFTFSRIVVTISFLIPIFKREKGWVFLTVWFLAFSCLSLFSAHASRFSRHSMPQASLLWCEIGFCCPCPTLLRGHQWPWPCGASPVSLSLLPPPSGSQHCILTWWKPHEQGCDWVVCT